MKLGEVVKVKGQDKTDVMAAFLGEFEGREWYWRQGTEEIFWRVPDIRECIAAPPGFKVLSADYAQIEVKLMAFLSQDPALIAAINSKKDIHCYNSVEVYGKRLNFTYEDIFEATQSENAKKHPRHKELKAIRSGIKTTTFGVPYGATAKRVAQMVFETAEPDAKQLAAAQGFIDSFFEGFPVLKAWLDRQGNEALLLGFTATPDGRRRFYEMPDSGDPDYDGMIAQIRRWAGNHPIQAANADMLKKAIRLIYVRVRGGNVTGPKLYNCWFCLVVHDEIVMMCADEDVEAVKQIMLECMTEAYDSIITGIYNKIDVVADNVWDH